MSFYFMYYGKTEFMAKIIFLNWITKDNYEVL